MALSSCLLKLIIMDELLKSIVEGMQKKLATKLGTSGPELDLHFRENLICKTDNNDSDRKLRLGTGNLDFSLAIFLTNLVTLGPMCKFSGL